MKLIRIHESDDVAVALADVAAGETFLGVTVLEPIPRGHKLALRPKAVGQSVIKYGLPIGHATQVIRPGQWVHTHNLASALTAEFAPGYRPRWQPLPPELPGTFMGYRRPDGRVAVRNEIWILPLVGCVNDVAKQLACQNQHLVGGSLDGLYAFAHPFGCSQTGEDHAATRRLLASLANHPNAAAVLLVGLGCENLTREQMERELGDYDREKIRFLICQDVEDELSAGAALLEQCAEVACRYHREPLSADGLVVGMKCGGSDGLSGVTANPTVGAFCNHLCACGGSAILTEVPEMFGAEELLFARCADEGVFHRAVDMIDGFRRYFADHGENVYENPSPGNRAGGITTLEDKSCGCVQKGGSAPVSDVIGYGERVRRSGLTLLCGPGNDLVSATALTAAGAHLILFTTGRGTPFGAPAPTIKIATNSELARRKGRWIDFDASAVAEGEPVEQAAQRLMQRVLAVASGETTCSERMNCRDIAIFKRGVTL